jgi:AAA-like domain
MIRRKAKADLTAPMHAQIAPGVRQIVSNLVVASDGRVWAGYRIGASRWDFMPLEARSGLIEASADVWAELAGRDFRERVTNRPHPVAAWAADLDRRTPNPVPDVDGETWDDYLVRMQRRIGASGMEDKIVFRWFTVGTAEPGRDVRGEILTHARTGTPVSAEVGTLLAEEKRVHDAVTGWRAARMTEREQGWIHERSLAPGMPAPMRAAETGWDVRDLPELSNDVRWAESRFDRTVEVTAWRDGVQQTRHVQVLTAARLADLHYPENGLEPWQAFAERLVDSDGSPIAVEWSLQGRIRSGEELAKQATLDLNKAININDTYRLFDELPPEYTERGISLAKEIRDQVTTGQPRYAARFVGTINAIIVGEETRDRDGRVTKSAEASCEERADAFRRLYGSGAMRMDFTAAHGQAMRLRETVPGESYDTSGYQRQVRLSYLAAGMPNVSSAIGDGRGPYIGFTLGAARRPVMHDPWYATEGRGELGRSQNMWAVVSTLGGGKSVLLESIAYHGARRGGRVVARDPSGPMMALCQMPELRGISRSLNLLEGERGILNPPSLIRYDLDSATSEDEALAQRRALTIDVARRCLTPDLYGHPATFGVLRRAAGLTRWSQYATMWNLINGLETLGDEHADQVSAALRDAADMPLFRLLFPPEKSTDDFSPASYSGLTVISTPGIRRAPDSSDRVDWTATEHAADPILLLTSLYTDRLLFSKPRHERAIGIFDEAEDLLDTGTGRGQLNRLGRDHSKWNIAVYLGLKNVTDEMMGGELRNFLAGAFVGRMANPEPAEAMLSILHIEDKSYARVLMELSTRRPGEFVHLDADGRVGGLKVDVDYHQALRNVVLTNPTPAGAEGWAYREGELV